ncbi:MAG: hypothetical protein ACE5JS_00160 [Nitrospinota bacterium]
MRKELRRIITASMALGSSARFIVSLFAFSLFFLLPTFLHAHGIQEVRYSPPIPGWLFLIGGGLAVALSFVLIHLRSAHHKPVSGYARLHIRFGPGLRFLGHLLSAMGLLLGGLVLAGRFLGDPRSEDTLPSVLVWSGWWIGLAWLTLMIGNAWPALDPWNTLRRIYGRWFARPLSLGLRFPAFLSAWPAVLLFTGFIWFELGWFQASEAEGVVTVFLIFTGWLWVGMAVFKPEDWWDNANPFARYFRVLGRFGPLEKRGIHIEARIPGTALHDTRLGNSSEAIFVIVVLFAVTFDGFVATPEWWVLLRRMMLKSFEILPKGIAFHASFLFAILVGAATFGSAYFLVCRIMSHFSDGLRKTREIARDFAMTLVPIAAAYHIAHFIPAVPSRVTGLVQAMADPLSLGWHLFGWHSFKWDVKWTPETAGIIWVAQTGLIVLGHIVSIWSAHRRALILIGDKSKASKVELPVAILMICYTVVSLWIISRPVLNEPLVPIPGLTR